MRGGGFGGSSGPPERLLKTGAGSVEKKPAGCPFKASFR